MRKIYSAVGSKLNNQFERDRWVKEQIGQLPIGAALLDAGGGSQRYRQLCSELKYKSQDFGKYTGDEKVSLGTSEAIQATQYEYGPLDYVGDIWDVDEIDCAFDAILCTEVLEHIAYPNETVFEFYRLLKPGGKLILTAPSNSLRHFDPYFFYTGFTDRWFKLLLDRAGFEDIHIEPVGDYYSWLKVEMARTGSSNSIFSKAMLAPAFLYFSRKKKTKVSVNSLCMGYHVTAVKP